MDTVLARARHVWPRRVGSLIIVVAFYYLAWDLAFRWLWQTDLFRALVPQPVRDTYPWLQLYANHTWALLIALLSIWYVGRPKWREWSGLTLQNLHQSLVAYRTFLVFILLYAIILHGLVRFSGQSSHPFGPETMINMTGWLTFQALMSGPAEEILFRGLFHSYLRSTWDEIVIWKSQAIPVAGIAAALLFAVVHINFTPIPFSIVHFDFLQVSGAFFLGLLYSIMYHRTGSLVFPMLAHSTSNVLAVGLAYLW